ncbi:fibrillarin [Ordospora pajunii]|uniref:fibrillarin n=1 Tax=Ordospora pajunii TaxID=3039483 RepID=UPI0029527F3A|nr:fibrillarin [Ordospora pajunii]KAH9410774.1 fibrillarin [Ordospora pajunii]
MEHLLFEYAGGYGLFELIAYEDMSKSSYEEYMRLSQVVRYKSGMQFEGVGDALEHMRSLSKGEIHTELKNFLELNRVKVVHCDVSLKKGLDAIGIKHKSSENIMRGVRMMYEKLMRLEGYDRRQMELGLSHGYSREKVEYNVKREDCIVMHTVMLLDQVDKDINSYSMRIREMYGWVFPELGRKLKENGEYVKAVKWMIMKERGELMGEEIGDERIGEIARMKETSIGMNILPDDLENMRKLIEVVEEKIEIRRELNEYLGRKMGVVAPNLAAILGNCLSARMICQAGGLFNLGKAPASTVQLFGAEKSLFRSLKMKSRTPKYGLIYGAGCLSRMKDKDKGRMSRYIATKCSIAAKIDCFNKERTSMYGMELKELIDKKIQSLHSKDDEKVEVTADVVQRVFDKINGKEKSRDEVENESVENKPKRKCLKSDIEDVFRFGKKNSKKGSKDEKRVSFDLTRNAIKETDRGISKFKRRS